MTATLMFHHNHVEVHAMINQMNHSQSSNAVKAYLGATSDNHCYVRFFGLFARGIRYPGFSPPLWH